MYNGKDEKQPVVVMGEEPAPELSYEKALEKYLAIENEKDLADVYAVVENKAWWFAHDIDDYGEETKEYEEQCKLVNDWFSLVSRMQEDIFKILREEDVEIPKIGLRYTIQPFMSRNGYYDGAGWWIKD